MRTVTEQELLDITADEYRGLGYFDAGLVVRVWDEAGRIKGLPYPFDIYNGVAPYSEEGHEIFRNWLKEQDAAYYAAPREDFNLHNAVQHCLDEGKKLVYVEDLS